MLAALAPDIAKDFPDARFVHFIRDGRLAAYITARLEWSRIIRSPGKYIEFYCPLSFSEVLKKMAEYSLGAVPCKEKQTLYVNFITQVSPACDCYGHSDAPIVPDIGILAPTDPVALDQA